MITLPDPRRRRTVAAGLLVVRELEIGASGCGVNGGLLGIVVGTLIAVVAGHAGPIRGAALVAPVGRLVALPSRRAAIAAIGAALASTPCVSLPRQTGGPGDLRRGGPAEPPGAAVDRPRRLARLTPMPAAPARAPWPA